jgi:hypothetical protein
MLSSSRLDARLTIENRHPSAPVGSVLDLRILGWGEGGGHQIECVSSLCPNLKLQYFSFPPQLFSVLTLVSTNYKRQKHLNYEFYEYSVV